MKNLSVRKFLKIVCSGVLLTAANLLLIMYMLTGDSMVVLCGLILTAALFAWGILFLKYFQIRLSCFTDSLCQTLDAMMDGNERPNVDYYAETILSRISHRLDRLYNTMQENHRKVEAEKAELQSLVSDISHQTKTPIANLKMINDTLLTRSVPKNEQQDFLHAMGCQLDKLDFLIQAMVKTSRLETGIITLEKKDSPIADTLAAAINGILAFMEQKQLTLSVECSNDLTVVHDSRWTSEALFNLLDNAVKYTPSGGSIKVTVQALEMYVKINVSDTGQGIPESSHATIFTRFYREESVHDIDGIGIGLYLAREIISMQGGYIKVASKIGSGSTFSVLLPRR